MYVLGILCISKWGERWDLNPKNGIFPNFP